MFSEPNVPVYYGTNGNDGHDFGERFPGLYYGLGGDDRITGSVSLYYAGFNSFINQNTLDLTHWLNAPGPVYNSPPPGFDVNDFYLTVQGPEGFDTLLKYAYSMREGYLDTGFKGLLFVDGMYDPATQAFAARPEAEDTLRLYHAALGRDVDAEGATFWITQLMAGLSRDALTASFTHSGEFQAQYGTLGTAELVSRLYENAFGRPADAAGAAFWQDALDNRGLNHEGLVASFAFSDEMTAKVQAETAHGLVFA